MFDSRRTPRPATLLPVVLSILVLVALPTAARSQPFEPPPRSDTITAKTNFLRCIGNYYALCYYSGPATPGFTDPPVPNLPCILNNDGSEATCTCYVVQDQSPNYVAISAILNPAVRQETIKACEKDGSGCWNMKDDEDESCTSKSDPGCGTAPVCNYLGNVDAKTFQTLYPYTTGSVISTYSDSFSSDYVARTKECGATAKYAGCMTAVCSNGRQDPDTNDPVIDCTCPTYVGSYQISYETPGYYLDKANAWSASNIAEAVILE